MAKKVMITDTILRDAHQSQAATRMRIEDMLPACEILDSVGYWSLECWGGATFDSCMRFLGEDPWERLRTLRKALPNTKLQMLLRGQNLLGYKHYADDVVDAFVGKSIENGIDVIGGKRMNCGRTDAKSLGILFIFLDVTGGDLTVGHALLVCAADDLIVNVGEVLHEGHLVAAIFKITAEHIEHGKATRVADVEKVIYRRTAGVHLDFAGRQGDEFLFFKRECVVKLNHGKPRY